MPSKIVAAFSLKEKPTMQINQVKPLCHSLTHAIRGCTEVLLLLCNMPSLSCFMGSFVIIDRNILVCIS